MLAGLQVSPQLSQTKLAFPFAERPNKAQAYPADLSIVRKYQEIIQNPQRLSQKMILS